MSARAVLAVLWIASAIGCREDEVKKLEALRDELCKCTSVECGEAVMQRVPVIAEAGDRRSQAVARAMLGCMAKLYENARPEVGPDVETGVETGVETEVQTDGETDVESPEPGPRPGSAASVP